MGDPIQYNRLKVEYCSGRNCITSQRKCCFTSRTFPSLVNLIQQQQSIMAALCGLATLQLDAALAAKQLHMNMTSPPKRSTLCQGPIHPKQPQWLVPFLLFNIHVTGKPWQLKTEACSEMMEKWATCTVKASRSDVRCGYDSAQTAGQQGKR